MRTRLPTELILYVLSFLPPDTKLYPILFVGPGFRAEVERRLYTRINLTGNLIGVEWAPVPGRYVVHEGCMYGRRKLLIKMLSRTPRISIMVQTLTVSPFIWRSANLYSYGHCETTNEMRSYWLRLNLALQAMPNLKEFAVGSLTTTTQMNAPIPIKSLFRGCSFHLRRLVILGIDSQLVELESGAHSLRRMDIEELVLPSKYASWSFLEAEVFPKLMALEITGRWVQCNTAVQLMNPSRIGVKALYLTDMYLHPGTKCYSYPLLLSLRICIGWGGYDWSGVGHWVAVTFASLRFFRLDYPPYWVSVLCEFINPLLIWAQDRTNELIRLATESFRAQRDLVKIVFCAGSVEPRLFGDKSTWRDRWVPAKGEATAWNQLDGLQLLANVPQLRTVRFGLQEWGRDGAVYTVDDNPEEWRDRAWWD